MTIQETKKRIYEVREEYNTVTMQINKTLSHSVKNEISKQLEVPRTNAKEYMAIRDEITQDYSRQRAGNIYDVIRNVSKKSLPRKIRKIAYPNKLSKCIETITLKRIKTNKKTDIIINIIKILSFFTLSFIPMFSNSITVFINLSPILTLLLYDLVYSVIIYKKTSFPSAFKFICDYYLETKGERETKRLLSLNKNPIFPKLQLEAIETLDMKIAKENTEEERRISQLKTQFKNIGADLLKQEEKLEYLMMKRAALIKEYKNLASMLFEQGERIPDLIKTPRYDFSQKDAETKEEKGKQKKLGTNHR